MSKKRSKPSLLGYMAAHTLTLTGATTSKAIVKLTAAKVGSAQALRRAAREVREGWEEGRKS